MEKQQIDYGQFQKDKLISIKDLWEEIIRKFWLIIILAIAGAVVLGGYKYLSDKREAETAEDVEELSDLEDNLSEEEMNEVNNILRLKEDVQQQQEYLDNSVLIQINAYDESRVDLQYRISDAQGNEQDILNAYESYVGSGALAADLQEKGVDLEVQYINELISFENSDISVNSSDNTLLFGSATNTFDVIVIHKDQESCETLAQSVSECIESYQTQLSELIGTHGLSLLDQSYSRVVDTDIRNYKVDRTNNLISAQDTIESLTEELNASQTTVLDQYEQQAEAESEEGSQTEAEAGISKKYVAAGGLAGIVLAILIIVIWYALRDTVNSARDVQRVYNIGILGELEITKSRNIFLKLWYSITGKTKRKVPFAEAVQILSTKVRMFCRKNDIKKVLIIGYPGMQGKDDWASELSSFLKDSGIRSEIAENVLYSSAVMEKLMEYEHVILVERLRHSRYSDMVDEVRLCLEQNVSIEGAIVLS